MSVSLKVVALAKSQNSALVAMNVPVEGTPFVTSVTGNFRLDPNAPVPEVGDVFAIPDGLELKTDVRVTEDGTEFLWFSI